MVSLGSNPCSPHDQLTITCSVVARLASPERASVFRKVGQGRTPEIRPSELKGWALWAGKDVKEEWTGSAGPICIHLTGRFVRLCGLNGLEIGLFHSSVRVPFPHHTGHWLKSSVCWEKFTVL